MTTKLLIGIIFVIVGVLGYLMLRSGDAPVVSVPPANASMVTLETTQGNIALELYANDAPKTVANFLTLARKGYYDGLTFHRVIPGFMIQGGDPNCSADGEDKGFCGGGGPGYQFEDELNPTTASYKAGYRKGVLAMANAGPNTNGSQFFILVADYPLPHNYTIFGRVTAGQEVADAVSKVKRNANDRPLQPVVITRAVVSP